MAAGKHGSTEWVISIDDAPGGTLRVITPYVTTIGGIKLTSITQVITAISDTFVKASPTGVSKIDPVALHGFFDDTATVGPHVIFKTTDTTIWDGTTATSRTFTALVGNSRTFTGECFAGDYTVLGKNGNLTEYEVMLTFTGSGSWS